MLDFYILETHGVLIDKENFGYIHKKWKIKKTILSKTKI